MKITYWNLLTHIYVPIWRSISFAILGIPLGIRCHLTALKLALRQFDFFRYICLSLLIHLLLLWLIKSSTALFADSSYWIFQVRILIVIWFESEKYLIYWNYWQLYGALVFGVVRDCLRRSVGGKRSEQRCLRWWRYHLLHYWLSHTLLYCSWSVGCI